MSDEPILASEVTSPVIANALNPAAATDLPAHPPAGERTTPRPQPIPDDQNIYQHSTITIVITLLPVPTLAAAPPALAEETDLSLAPDPPPGPHRQVLLSLRADNDPPLFGPPLDQAALQPLMESLPLAALVESLKASLIRRNQDREEEKVKAARQSHSPALTTTKGRGGSACPQPGPTIAGQPPLSSSPATADHQSQAHSPTEHAADAPKLTEPSAAQTEATSPTDPPLKTTQLTLF